MTNFNFNVTPTRLITGYIIIFTLSIIVLAVTTYLSVQNSLEQQMRRHIESELSQLLVDYYEDGLDELRHDISENIETSHSQRMYYSLVAPNGVTIFDRIAQENLKAGWHYIKGPDQKPALIYKQQLKDGYNLLIGQDLELLLNLQELLRHKFFITLLVTFLIGFTSIYVLSNYFIKRIKSFEVATKNIGNGDLSERLPVLKSGDVFDGMAIIINKMLDRIEHLMEKVKYVSSNIAHDMRTPLSKMRLELENMLKLVDNNPQHKKACANIISMLDESLEIFSSILRITQIESGVYKANFKCFNLSDRVEDIYQTFKLSAKNKKIKWHATIEPNISIYGDNTLISQALVNIIENALTHAKTLNQITIHLYKKADTLVIECTDNGIGVPEEKFALLTQAFFRLDTSRSTKGHGLGLNLVAAVAELHGGKIAFANKNPGLSVGIILPLSD